MINRNDKKSKEKVIMSNLFKKHIWFLIVSFALFSCQSVPKTAQQEFSQKKTFTCLDQSFLVIGIDERSEKKLGPFPWSRQVLADSLARLKPAKTVVLAFTLDQKQSSRVDRKLERAVAEHKGVVLQAKPVGQGSASAKLYQRNLPYVALNRVSYRAQALMVPYTALRDRSSAMGFRLSSMGKGSSFPIAMGRGGEVYPSLALSALMSHYGLSRTQVRTREKGVVVGRKQAELSHLNSFPNRCHGVKVAYHSFIELKDDELSPKCLRGKVVILSLARQSNIQKGPKGKQLYQSPFAAQLVSLFSWYEY